MADTNIIVYLQPFTLNQYVTVKKGNEIIQQDSYPLETLPEVVVIQAATAYRETGEKPRILVAGMTEKYANKYINEINKIAATKYEDIHYNIEYCRGQEN